MIGEDKSTREAAANDENVWVRARILKRDPPPEGSLLKIAERARDMAANSLGRQHAAYAVALQNLGLYFEIIDDDRPKADAYFAQARAIVGENDLPLAYGFHWLGVFHHQESHDGERAQAMLAEALAIERRAVGSDDLQLADTMVALAQVKAAAEIHSAIALTEEALQIRRAKLPVMDPAIQDTEKQLAILRALASTEAPDRSA